MQTIGSTSGLRNNAKLFGHTSVVTDIHGRALPWSKWNVAFGLPFQPVDAHSPAVAQSSQFGPFSAPSECPLFPKAAIQMSLRASWHPIPTVQPQRVGPVAFGSKRKAFHRPITRKRPCWRPTSSTGRSRIWMLRSCSDVDHGLPGPCNRVLGSERRYLPTSGATT